MKKSDIKSTDWWVRCATYDIISAYPLINSVKNEEAVEVNSDGAKDICILKDIFKRLSVINKRSLTILS